MTNPDLHKQSTNQSGNHSSGNIIGDHTQIHIYPGSQSQPDELFDAEEVEARYRRQVFKHYNKLALTGLPERDPGLHELTLEYIFVKLNVTIQQSLSFGRSLDQLSLEEEWRRPSRPSRTDDRRMRAELRRLEREASQPQIISLSVAEALRQRIEQRRRMYAITHWTILLIGIIMVAFGLSYLDANTRLMQVITVLGGLIGMAISKAKLFLIKKRIATCSLR